MNRVQGLALALLVAAGGMRIEAQADNHAKEVLVPILLSNRVRPNLAAPVFRPDGSGGGPAVSAQLFHVLEDGELVPIEPVTKFRGSVASPYLNIKTVFLKFDGAPPKRVKVRLRAWEGDSWETARLHGESSDVELEVDPSVRRPILLKGLKGFTLQRGPGPSDAERNRPVAAHTSEIEAQND